MANIVEWVMKHADVKDIEGVCMQPRHVRNRGGIRHVLSWEQAKPLLDFDFDDGLGEEGCDAVYVWTKKSILFVTDYDGKRSMACLPRNPAACRPILI